VKTLDLLEDSYNFILDFDVLQSYPADYHLIVKIKLDMMHLFFLLSEKLILQILQNAL
jgi:hypothetical protein